MSVVLTQKDAVARMMIDREPRRNALDSATLELMIKHIHELNSQAEVAVLVMTGAGEKCFCAGGDLSGLTGGGFLSQHEGRSSYMKLLKALHETPKLTVARVRGDALGGGLGLAMACDLVLAAETARFGTPEIKVGLFPMMVMALLLRNMPRKKAMEIMFTGGKITAAQAEDWGMINHCWPVEDFDAKVEALLEQVSGFSPAILRLGKEAFINMQGMAYGDSLSYLHGMLTLAANTEDAVEGVTAFLQKRRPEWKGQ